MIRHIIGNTILVFLALATAATGQAQPCPCDCDANGRVNIGELISAVGIALGDREVSTCDAADFNDDARVVIGELISCVRAALNGCDNAFPTPTTIPTPTNTPNSEIPPLGDAALSEWLQAGNYLGWRSEPEQHDSAGPHFGDVRTFINDTLSSSLELVPPSTSLRQGSAAVKELFGSSGTEVRGWAVMIKVEENSDGGNGWYWYERFGNSVFADGQGVRGCTGCHSTSTMTHVSRDFFLSSGSFPSQ